MVKLVNFFEVKSLNNLRSKMLAPIAKNYVGAHKIEERDSEYITKLETEGVDVKIDEITFEKDKTLSFQGQSVLVYIKDVSHYGNKAKDPKFHFSNCDTLKKMKEQGKWQKYVASHKDDGYFQVCFNNSEYKYQKLDVCQNCLDFMGWNNFSFSHMAYSSRYKIVSEFSISEFFTKYPKTLLSSIPEHTADTAPRNDYTTDWPEISNKLKSQKFHRCEVCQLHLVEENKRFLHVHHVNGLRNDNSKSNLKVLCIGCHSKQPNHSHLKVHQDYTTFTEKFHINIK